MAVVSCREVIPRTFSHKFGESPTAERKFVATLDEPTPHQTIIGSVGIGHGFAHPEYPYLRMLDAQLTETDRHHVELTYKYELPSQQDLDPNPLARPDVWSFSTGGAQVPALVYYSGSGNANRKPLQNSAKDFFEGLTVNEAEVRATISGNRSAFPLALAAEVTNSVNSAGYLGGAAHTWFCSGIGGQQATEVVNDTEIRYWQVTVELIFRASGHSLLLPDVGWNYLDGTDKKRVWVKDSESVPPEKVASASPRALTTSGAMKGDNEEPDILIRRVYPEANFASFFGTPPF
jgi:hypothetical protein